VIASVAGRSSDQLRRSDGSTIDPHQVFALILRAAPRAVDFQLRQDEDLAVEADIVPAGAAPDRAEGRRVKQALNELIGVDDAARVTYVDRIPLAASGKFRHLLGAGAGPPP
jgi:hypothetical protein